MKVDQATVDEVTKRLRRVQGQVGGLIAMIEDGRDCTEVITQLSAASRALNRAGLKIVSSGMQQCAAAAERGEKPELTADQIEKLFLSLA
jgi:DNA-binding FrmR family transcriptional regulator